MTLARAHRWLARRAVSLPILGLVAIAFLSPLFAKPMHLGHGDWLWFHFTWESSRKTILGFHELPAWNPYYCGGTLGIENPQSVALSPFFLLLLPFPTAVGMKLHLLLMTFAGAVGTFELLRLLRAHAAAALVGAVLFACSGAIGWHMNGQLAMAAFQLFPWAMLSLELSLRRRHPLASWGIGVALATMVLSGGVYPIALSSVALGLRLVGERGALRRGLAPLVTGGAVAAGLAAAKLVPMAMFLAASGRPIERDDAISPSLLLPMLVVRRTTETQIWDRAGGYVYAWWGEYGNHVGWLGLALVAVALAYANRKAAPWLVGLALCLAFLMGDHGPGSPFHWLRALPVFGSLRVPTRFWMVANLFLAAAVSLGLSRILRGKLPAAARWIALALGLAVSFDLVRTNGIAVFAGAMQTPPAPADQGAKPMRLVRHPAHRMFELPAQNLGTPACWDEVRVPGSLALRPDAPSEVWLRPPGGEAEVVKWTPSSVAVRVKTEGPATLFVNQNAAPGWTVDGSPMAAQAGLVGAAVPAGERVVVFRRRPPGWWVGWGVSFVVVAAGVWVVGRRWWGRRR